MLNTQLIKKDFPIFHHHPNLVYLDSTATSLKPKQVIDKTVEYYEKYSANIFRGIYKISEKATEEYEKTREVISEFINAKFRDEVIFTRNTTEALNLLAYSLGRKIIEKKDEIVTTVMEHHSNFVPWQQLAFEIGATFKVIDIDDKGYLPKIDLLDKIITKRTKILALTYISNVLGTINPIKAIIKAAKEINPQIITIVDAAQAIPHLKIDVQELGCDFLAFSAHKMLGPTGVGVLWGKQELLEAMFPFQYGGEMVAEVTINQTTFKGLPLKYEAGTPDIANVVALKEAVYYLQKIGLQEIQKHEKELTAYCLTNLKNNFKDKVRFTGPELENRSGIISFTFSNYHPHDVAQILDEKNIAVRAGHHCAMPLHQRLKLPATVRASFYLYNDKQDVDKLIDGLKHVESVLK